MVVEGARGSDTEGWDTVEGADPGFDPGPHWRAVQAQHVLTLIYTSGTTGPPKGAQVTHRNLMATVAVADDVIKFPDGSKVISWLPAAHIAERHAHHYLQIVFAMTITAARTRARSSATCRRSNRPGSSPCRGSSRSSRPA